ncbi:MAG TPA: hypothetical protein VHL11_13765 [Phototrophicaceae bacterium]|jgi:hypothetical protein|nr:hypothetical protein [Phototrophicaceae bacterium]
MPDQSPWQPISIEDFFVAIVEEGKKQTENLQAFSELLNQCVDFEAIKLPYDKDGRYIYEVFVSTIMRLQNLFNLSQLYRQTMHDPEVIAHWSKPQSEQLSYEDMGLTWEEVYMPKALAYWQQEKPPGFLNAVAYELVNLAQVFEAYLEFLNTRTDLEAIKLPDNRTARWISDALVSAANQIIDLYRLVREYEAFGTYPWMKMGLTREELFTPKAIDYWKQISVSDFFPTIVKEGQEQTSRFQAFSKIFDKSVDLDTIKLKEDFTARKVDEVLISAGNRLQDLFVLIQTYGRTVNLNETAPDISLSAQINLDDLGLTYLEEDTVKALEYWKQDDPPMFLYAMFREGLIIMTAPIGYLQALNDWVDLKAIKFPDQRDAQWFHDELLKLAEGIRDLFNLVGDYSRFKQGLK